MATCPLRFTASFLLMLVTSGVSADEPAGADLEMRIRAAETGLGPAVRAAGKPARRWTLAERMDHYKNPGLSIAVINDGRIEWARGYGVKTAGDPEPVTPETLFQAGSISKPVAALVALALVESGRLELDSDVNAALKSWKVPSNTFTEQSPVTLRGLLTHTAGLTVHGFPGYTAGAHVPTVVQVLDGEKPANTAPVRVNTVPGRVWRYSGGGYTVMQLLVQDVTGQAFPDVARELVLAKLGMDQSTYEQPLPERLRPQAATGHNGGAPIAGRYHTYPEMAAAGLWTTPTDLACVAVEVQRTLRGESDRVLSRAGMERMLTPGLGEYGLGFTIGGSGDARTFSHGGVDEGFQALLVGYSRLGKGAVVMTNSDRGLDLIDELLRSVAAAYAWPDRHARAVNVVAVEPALLDEYAGDYQLGVPFSGPRGWFAFSRDGDHLVVSQAGGEEGELLALSQTAFIHESGEYRATFHRDDAGRITGMMIHRGAEPETADIGLALEFDAPAGDPVVKRVLEGNAAARDGRIKAGDRLVGIENEAGALVAFRGKSLDQIAGLMRGPDGTKVMLVVVPKGFDERVAIALTRAPIGIAARRVKTEK
jgi:CubicO group peptidase (beta-lactamase class C family)